MSYSSDKDRLEIELRKCLIIRLIEGSGTNFDLEKEKNLSNQLAAFFGKNFIHRFNLILTELNQEE
jgi:hypothetical protein